MTRGAIFFVFAKGPGKPDKEVENSCLIFPHEASQFLSYLRLNNILSQRSPQCSSCSKQYRVITMSSISNNVHCEDCVPLTHNAVFKGENWNPFFMLIAQSVKYSNPNF